MMHTLLLRLSKPPSEILLSRKAIRKLSLHKSEYATFSGQLAKISCTSLSDSTDIIFERGGTFFGNLYNAFYSINKIL
jgi:hypothetical protein